MSNIASASDLGYPPLPENEYDGYLFHLDTLIRSGGSDADLFNYINTVENEYLMVNTTEEQKREFIRQIRREQQAPASAVLSSIYRTDRTTILRSLLDFDVSLDILKSEVGALSWDHDPVVTLTRSQIVAVLKRFAVGDLDAVAVEDWANLIESREDIEYEAGHHEIILDAITDLANPYLQGSIEENAPRLLKSLPAG